MPSVRGCNLPDDLLYDVDNHIWFKAMGDGTGESQTQTGQFMGTPQFMAPEQIRNTKGVDQRADIWALGVILYQMVTGQILTVDSGMHLGFAPLLAR